MIIGHFCGTKMVRRHAWLRREGLVVLVRGERGLESHSCREAAGPAGDRAGGREPTHGTCAGRSAGVSCSPDGVQACDLHESELEDEFPICRLRLSELGFVLRLLFLLLFDSLGQQPGLHVRLPQFLRKEDGQC